MFREMFPLSRKFLPRNFSKIVDRENFFRRNFSNVAIREYSIFANLTPFFAKTTSFLITPYYNRKALKKGNGCHFGNFFIFFDSVENNISDLSHIFLINYKKAVLMLYKTEKMPELSNSLSVNGGQKNR